MAALNNNTNAIRGLIDDISNLPLDRSNEAYEQGSIEGYTKGYAEGEESGYTKGHADGLAARTYEVWEFTLTDGTVIEKEVALL